MQELNTTIPKRIGGYELRQTIGYGAFSVVKLAYSMKLRTTYACKIIPFSKLLTEKTKEQFEKEIRIAQQMHHPHVVAIVDLLMDRNNYYVFSHHCPNGELYQYIVERGRMPEDEARPYFAELIDGLRYIHNQKVSHRDIKPENLLLDEMGRLKICDFGLSTYFGDDHLVVGPCGSPTYASPECLSGKPYDGMATDIWSCGVVLYSMVTGSYPWTKRVQSQLFQQIKSGSYKVPAYLSKDCEDLIRRMISVDYRNRITIDDIFKHPWMEEYELDSYYSEPNMTLSLRKIDRIFGRDVPTENIPQYVRSCSMNEFDTTIGAFIKHKCQPVHSRRMIPRLPSDRALKFPGVQHMMPLLRIKCL